MTQTIPPRTHEDLTQVGRRPELLRSGSATLGCFIAGGAGYLPVTFYSEGSVGSLTARCKPLELRVHAHHLAVVEA